MCGLWFWYATSRINTALQSHFKTMARLFYQASGDKPRPEVDHTPERRTPHKMNARADTSTPFTKGWIKGRFVRGFVGREFRGYGLRSRAHIYLTAYTRTDTRGTWKPRVIFSGTTKR